MATTDVISGNPDRSRRRPFSTWVKKLTNFKNSSDGDRSKPTKAKRGNKLNNPYPESGTVSANHGQHTHSVTSFGTQQTGFQSVGQSTRYSHDDISSPLPPPSGGGGRSIAGTFSTTEEDRPVSLTAPSHGASSLTGTARTTGGGTEFRRGGDSTFSSPAPSVQSLATTLTTIQSLAAPAPAPTNNTAQSIQFSQPFPASSPASAIPSHLAPTAPPTTYSTATANNLLTDNASILTLASSSKRRRRRSMDTDASVRALAPSSLWGGSRESLPLSILSANVEAVPTSAGQAGSIRLGVERNSIYSTTGVSMASKH